MIAIVVTRFLPWRGYMYHILLFISYLLSYYFWKSINEWTNDRRGFGVSRQKPSHYYRNHTYLARAELWHGFCRGVVICIIFYYSLAIFWAITFENRSINEEMAAIWNWDFHIKYIIALWTFSWKIQIAAMSSFIDGFSKVVAQKKANRSLNMVHITTQR